MHVLQNIFLFNSRNNNPSTQNSECNLNLFATTIASKRKNKTMQDGSLPANPVNDRRVANAVTLKKSFRLPENQQLFKNI